MSDSTRPPLTFSFFPSVPGFALTSADIADGVTLPTEQVAGAMGYSGGNLSPQLTWHGFPDATQGFALTVHDPDAPTGSGFWHWVLVNIPVTVTSLDSGAGADDGSRVPVGSFHVRNDAGTMGYFGAAPPAGDQPHRYVHTVHALDVATLDVDASVAPAIIGFNLRFHTLARAQIVPVFGS